MVERDDSLKPRIMRVLMSLAPERGHVAQMYRKRLSFFLENDDWQPDQEMDLAAIERVARIWKNEREKRCCTQNVDNLSSSGDLTWR